MIVSHGPGGVWIADLSQPSTPVPMRRRDRRKQEREMKRWTSIGFTEDPDPLGLATRNAAS